jgi:hypothetical protein
MPMPGILPDPFKQRVGGGLGGGPVPYNPVVPPATLPLGPSFNPIGGMRDLQSQVPGPFNARPGRPIGGLTPQPALPGFGAPGTGGLRTGTQGQSVFNPSQLSQFLSGQFLRPGIPNFPQYQQATGGTSLLSNARWLNNATPSELGLYKGFLQDEMGIPPEDALSLAGKMAPQGGQLRSAGYRQTY